MSVGCYKVAAYRQNTHTIYPLTVVCAAPPEDEQVVLENVEAVNS
jgi:hypothetical protein